MIYLETPKINKDVQKFSRILCFQVPILCFKFLSVPFEFSVSFELNISIQYMIAEPEHIHCQNRLPDCYRYREALSVMALI